MFEFPIEFFREQMSPHVVRTRFFSATRERFVPACRTEKNHKKNHKKNCRVHSVWT